MREQIRRWVGPILGVGLAAGAVSAVAADVELSERCSRCHETIYKTWKTSVHADSLRNDNFLPALRETQETDGKRQAGLCLRCHAPIHEVNGDDDLIYHLTWEGVSCDICHSLKAVKKTRTGFDPVFESGGVKFGPFKDASDDAHPVRYSPLHTGSELCAWCHEYTNPEGTPILSTWSEWKKSKAAESGKPCQACHMGSGSDAVIDPRLDRDPSASINLHAAPGGHSLDQLHKALSVSLRPKRDGEAIDLAVQIRNKGAGHAVPTGMPGRRVLLDLEVRVAGKIVFDRHILYGRVLENAAGEEIRLDKDYFKPGVRLRSDTSIQPDETRVERFRILVDKKATATLVGKMYYEHTQSGSREDPIRILFFSEKRTVRPLR